MEGENEGLQKFSTKISRILCLNGSGRNVTLLAKDVTLLQESLPCPDGEKIFRCGSSSEGTNLLESDWDKMMVFSEVFVKISEDNTDDLEKTATVFRLDTRMCKPGYARLRHLEPTDTKIRRFDAICSENQVITKTPEGMFLSSEKFVEEIVSMLDHRFPGLSHHGPCATRKWNFAPYFSKQIDVAPALVCLEWPVEAKEWITRRRLQNWPNQSLIKEISSKKCHVVPIGKQESEYHPLEWRLSYLLGERELVWSFNDTQLHCYIILKRLLKHDLDDVAPDQLCSYNMKTIVFWLSEEKGLSMWFHENLMVCIEACLDRLYDCIQQRQLHHYFNSHANLFEHKFQNDQQKKQILEKIQEVRTNILSSVRNCLSLKAKQFSSYDLERIENAFSAFIKLEESTKRYTAVTGLLPGVTARDYKSILDDWTSFLTNPVEETYPFIGEKIKLFYEMRLAMACLKDETLRGDKEFIESKASHASKMDGMSGKLYLATIKQHLGYSSKSTTIVNTLLHTRKHLIYLGLCSPPHCIQLRGDGKSNQVSFSTLALSRESRDEHAYDVFFSKDDICCVPYPLQFECALAGSEMIGTCFVIHPCIYANFLMCYGERASKNFEKYLELLQLSVDESKGGKIRHHALNILACCYLLDCNYQKAFEIFKESLQETKHLKVSNAAAYHIAIILLKRFEEQKELQNSH